MAVYSSHESRRPGNDFGDDWAVAAGRNGGGVVLSPRESGGGGGGAIPARVVFVQSDGSLGWTETLLPGGAPVATLP